MEFQLQKDKSLLRVFWQAKRKQIDPSRREEAARKALAVLPADCERHEFVLSFASFSNEFSTQQLNQRLATQGKLLLPRIEKDLLVPYHVECLESQLVLNQYRICEPHPKKCRAAPLSKITLVLVPGLAYDRRNHRLGYGGGFYDRFLSTLSPKTSFFGLGFQEQLSSTPLPLAGHDHPLHELRLF